MTPQQLAAYIDHTVLKPETVVAQVEQLCREALEHEFAAVCVAPYWVGKAAAMLHGSKVKVATVAGFPHGNTLGAAKAYETRVAVAEGAQEVDMVLNIGALKDGDHGMVRDDIASVAAAAHAAEGVIVKVIFENALLTDDEKRTACRLCEEAGADFVKTSTGFAATGATVEDVRLMRAAVGDRLGVKAAGGIRDLATALAMVEEGATRIGCSASVAIVAELARR